MKSFMKDFLTAIAIVLVFCIGFGIIALAIVYGDKPKDIGENLTNGWYYALATEVIEIDHEADIVTCEDCNGNLWEFYGAENWEVGDNANLLMNSKGTPKIEDDKICGATYADWNLSH